MSVRLSKLKNLNSKNKILLCPESYLARLWARCSKCGRIYIGYKNLKEQGFFSSSEFIYKNCKEEGKSV
jgi:hypothetical protein